MGVFCLKICWLKIDMICFSKYYSMCNIVGKKEFCYVLFFFLLLFFRSLPILSDEASEAFDSFDRLHFLFRFSLLPNARKKEPSDSDISTLGEKTRSTYLRKKRGNIYYSHHQIDACLVQLILSLLFLAFFSLLFVRLCYCCTTF